MRVMVLNGPNLNWLGRRDPAVYGAMTLAEIHERLTKKAAAADCTLLAFQSNGEGALIDFLQEHADEVDGVIVNPGGLSHYSIALRDALAAMSVPVIEVHLSNIYARERFRHNDVIAGAVTGHIVGLGWRSYSAALDVLIERFQEQKFPGNEK